METEISEENIVLGIYEETVEDAFNQILKFLNNEGFSGLNNLFTTHLLSYASKYALAIEYFDAVKLGFYIFIFKDALMIGKRNIYSIPPSNNIHVIAVGINAKGNYNTLRWPKLSRCLKEKGSLQKISHSERRRK
jgi:hypothetical protein